jgi:hypothetical protein
MIIEFVHTKPKRWRLLADTRIRTYQVSYINNGKVWFQDVNVLPDEQFSDDPPTYIYCWLCQKFGSVSEVELLKEY